MLSHFTITFATRTNIDQNLTINFYPEANGQMEDTQLQAKVREMRNRGLVVKKVESTYSEE